MGYKAEYPSIESAKASAGEYEYALLYRISDLLLCPAADLKDSDWDECLEARLFRKDAELHILLEEEKKAVKIMDDGGEDVITEVYKLSGKSRKRLPSNMDKLVVKQYLQPDEDGQMFIALTRLAEIR